VYGNYDTYELLRQSREQSAKSNGQPVSREARPSAAPAKVKRKRKFPYRKVPDLEADIAAAEAAITRLEAALQDVDLYKDPPRLKQTMADLEAAKARLPQLYEHWEEAVELNG
jgi:ATP-binding cassette subfamily F protein 3